MAYSTTLTPTDQPPHHQHRQQQDMKQQQQQPSSRSYLSRPRSPLVSFSTVEIREYNRVLDGDYTDVRYGLTIGWEFAQRPPISLHEEQGGTTCQPLTSNDRKSSSSSWSSLCETSSKAASSTSSLTGTGLAIPKSKGERKRILCEFGYSKKDLTQSEKDRLRRRKGKSPKNQDDLASLPSSSSFLKLRFLRIPSKPLQRV